MCEMIIILSFVTFVIITFTNFAPPDVFTMFLCDTMVTIHFAIYFFMFNNVFFKKETSFMFCPCTIYFWSYYTFFQPYLIALLIWEITAFFYCFIFATFVAAFLYGRFQWIFMFMSFCMGQGRKIRKS